MPKKQIKLHKILSIFFRTPYHSSHILTLLIILLLQIVEKNIVPVQVLEPALPMELIDEEEEGPSPPIMEREPDIVGRSVSYSKDKGILGELNLEGQELVTTLPEIVKEVEEVANATAENVPQDVGKKKNDEEALKR